MDSSVEKESDKRLHELQAIEAALFIAARPMQLVELAEIAGIPPNNVSQLLNELKLQYSSRNSAIEIMQFTKENWLMQLKEEIGKSVAHLAPHPILSESQLRTLAFIAINQPLTKADIVQNRGKNAYQHVKELTKLNFIESKKSEKKILFTTTGYFSTYFGLPKDIKKMKEVLKQQQLITE